MKEYFHLLIIDDIVGNTWFVGIGFTSLQFKALTGLLVVHHTCHHSYVYGILALYN